MSYLPMDSVAVWQGGSIKRILTDVEGAARFLLKHWPETADGTDTYRMAHVSALKALSGRLAVSDFRTILVAAAEEAGILAEDDRQPEPSRQR